MKKTTEKPTEALSSRGRPPLHLQKSFRRQALRLVLAPVTWRRQYRGAREYRPLWGDGRLRSSPGRYRTQSPKRVPPRPILEHFHPSMTNLH